MGEVSANIIRMRRKVFSRLNTHQTEKKKKCSSLSVLCLLFASGAEKTSLSLSRKIDYTATTSASWFKLRIYRSIKLDNSFPVCESATIYARFCWVTLYIHHLWYMNYNKHWSEGRYSWMCWVVLIVDHIRPSYHRDMYVVKDKKSSANNQVWPRKWGWKDWVRSMEETLMKRTHICLAIWNEKHQNFNSDYLQVANFKCY